MQKNMEEWISTTKTARKDAITDEPCCSHVICSGKPWPSLSPSSCNHHGILGVPRSRANSVLFTASQYALAVSCLKAWSTSPDHHSATDLACLFRATCRARTLPFRTYSVLALPQTAATSIIRTLLRTLTSLLSSQSVGTVHAANPARELPLILKERFWHSLRVTSSLTSSSSKIR